jgi:hypothetical protein
VILIPRRCLQLAEEHSRQARRIVGAGAPQTLPNQPLTPFVKNPSIISDFMAPCRRGSAMVARKRRVPV